MSGVITEALGSKSGLQTCLLHLSGETFKSQFDPSHLPPGDRCTNSEQILDRFKEIVYIYKKKALWKLQVWERSMAPFHLPLLSYQQREFRIHLH